MTTGRFARIAARVLERELSQDTGRPSVDERAAAIARVEQALRERTRRRARMRWLAVSAAAAAVLLVAGAGYAVFGRDEAGRTLAVARPARIVVVAHPAGRGAVVDAAGAGAGEQLAEGRTLGRGSRVVARRDGRVVLSVSTGTRLIVEEGGALSVVDDGAMQHFALGAGAVRADVARLEPGERFVVSTSDAEVEVHGTSFRVAVVQPEASCGDGTPTRVEVFAGIVTVRHAGATAYVRPGQIWPSGCQAPSATSNEAPGARASAREVPVVPHAGQDFVPSAAPRSAGRPVAPGLGRVSGAPHEQAALPAVANTPSTPATPTAQIARMGSSMLAAQNDAFAEAVALRRSGQAGPAIAAFERFLERYPTGPLAESAASEHMRLLRGVSPARAAQAAHRYLARYPDGFARDEAEDILRGP